MDENWFCEQLPHNSAKKIVNASYNARNTFTKQGYECLTVFVTLCRKYQLFDRIAPGAKYLYALV